MAPTEEPVAEVTEEPDYVGLYASNTAKKAVEAQELANVISILVNSVQPQAANLLRNKFPAFQEAAENGEISSQIGMHVYYQRGDGDTLGHWTPDGAYALVQNHSIEHDDGSVAMGTLVSYNVYDIMTEDEDGREVLNQDPGAWMHFGGSVLHEFMHAFMSDYNRVGTTGSNDPEYDNPNSDPHDEDVEYYSRLMLSQLMFPDWFREGTAATMDYNYSFYGNYYQKFKAQNTGDDLPAYSADSIFDTYTKTIYFYPFYDLQSPGTNGSNYVSGYMAVLYLSELAAAGNEALGSSVSTGEDGKTVVDSEKLRLGLNDILKKLHNGETLDQVIAEVSGGAYADANDFEARFIKGTEEQGDEASLAFCANLLNYLEEVSGPDGKGITGSILFDFADQESIDPTRKAETNLFNVIGCNDFVESDADIPVPYTYGGYHKRGDEVPTNAEVVEYTAGLVTMEWAEKLEGIDNWDTMDQEDAIQLMLSLFFPTNILKMAEIIQGREDAKMILGEVADANMEYEWLFDRHDIEYDDGWDWDWDDDEDDDEDESDPAEAPAADTESDADQEADLTEDAETAEPADANAEEAAEEQAAEDESADAEAEAEVEADLTEDAETAELADADAEEAEEEQAAEDESADAEAEADQEADLTEDAESDEATESEAAESQE